MKECILVVEDDPINLDNITESLEEAGFYPLTAANGEEASKVMANQGDLVKVIILDWMMPKMDGMAFLKLLKREKRLQKIPVIMQTAKAQEQDIVQGMEEGVYQYLTKPFSEQVLISMVKAALKESDKLRAIVGEAEKKVDSIREYAFAMIERQTKRLELDVTSLQILNDFFISSLEVTDHQGMIELLLKSIKRFPFPSAPSAMDSPAGVLRCSLLLHSEVDLDLSDRGLDSKLDKMILQRALETGQVVKSGDYIAMASKNAMVGVLVRNSPKTPEEANKAIQVLSQLIDQFESRLIHFDAQLELLKKNQQIKGIHQINQTYQEMKESHMSLLEGLETKLKKETQSLEARQRQQIGSLIKESLDQSFQLYSQDHITDQQFLLTVEHLKGALEENNLEAQLRPGKFGGTSQAEIDALLAAFG